MDIAKIFEDLDDWLQAEAREALLEGFPDPGDCEIRVLGQSAVNLAKIDYISRATIDLDAQVKAKARVVTEFKKIVAFHGMVYDELSDEIRMPKATQYIPFYDGVRVQGFYADPISVMVSKAKFAPEKNAREIGKLLKSEKKQEFIDACEAEGVDITRFLLKSEAGKAR